MTQDYRNRINQIAEGIKHEPEMRKMRDDLSEGIKTTGNRQADVEEQFQEVIENTTGKDVISAPEIIAARKGEPSLDARITKQHSEVTAQLAQKIDEVKYDFHSGKVLFFSKDNLLYEIDITEVGNMTYVQNYIDTLVAEGQIDGVRIADGAVTPKNTTFLKEKNIFDGNYNHASVSGSMSEGIPLYRHRDENFYTAVIPIENNTNYVISKTPSDRFRVGLSYNEPNDNSSIQMIRDADSEGGDSATEFTFYSNDRNFLMIYVSLNGNPPTFMQVEKGTVATDWYTNGYIIENLAKPYYEPSGNRERDGKIYVSDFESQGKSDRQSIQDTFDSANGHIVVFEPKRYQIDDTVIADLSKVRGIDGQNALLEMTGLDKTVLKIKGSKETSGATPMSAGNRRLALSEMNGYVKHLRIASSDDRYIGTGIEIEGTYGLLIEHCHLFNLKHGIRFTHINRNSIIANSNIWNNSGNGIFWDNCNIHQTNMTGNHISYCNKALYLENSDVHNLQISGNDIECGPSHASGNPESLIHIFINETGYNYEAIIIDGNSLQAHGQNTAPLIMLESSARQSGLQDVVISNNQLANSLYESIWAEGLHRAVINGNSFKNYTATEKVSIDLKGNNRDVVIVGNNLVKGVSWSAETHRTLFANNLAQDFDMEDMDDGRVKMTGNF